MYKVNNKDTGILLLTLNIFLTFSRVSIVNFEQVNAGWKFLQSWKKLMSQSKEIKQSCTSRSATLIQSLLN